MITEDQIKNTIEFLKSSGFTSACFCDTDGSLFDFPSNKFFFRIIGLLPANFFKFIPWLDWFISLGMKHTILEKGTPIYLADMLVKKLEAGKPSCLALVTWIIERQLPIQYSNFCQLTAGVSDLPESLQFVSDRTKWNIAPLPSALGML